MKKKIVDSSSHKRKYSFEQKDTPIKKFDSNRVFLVRKLNQNEKSIEISKEINDYFSSPEEYFKKNSPVTVGRKIIIFDMNDHRVRRKNKLKTEKSKGINLFNHLSSFAATIRNKGELTSFLEKGNNKKRADFNSKFEVINNDKLKMLFNSYRRTDNQFTTDISSDKSQTLFSDNSFMRKEYNNQRKKLLERNKYNYKFKIKSQENIPKPIKMGLNLQNKKLNILKKSELKNQKISQYLARRINKTQNDLLLNRIDSFRFKQELIKEMEYNKPIEEEFGRYKWNVSLRRPEHFRGMRKTYVNLSREKSPDFWSLIVEKSPKQKNISIKPEYTLSEGEIHEYQKQIKILSDINDNNKNINPYFQTLEKLDGIIVKGKNLFNLEYKREIIDSKNNKIWHKVFVDNGKTISIKDINKIYGNETFYKNYDKCITEKNNINKFAKINF